MNQSTSFCEHEKTDEFGICAACGKLTRVYSYTLYENKCASLELAKQEGTISDEEYKKKKAKLDYIKEYSIEQKLWNPYTYGSGLSTV